MQVLEAMKLPVFLVAVAGLIVYSESLTRTPTRTDRVEIVYWEKWNDFEGNAMREVVNDFNASQDKIFVRYLTVSGIENKTLTSTAAGIPPDVAGLYDKNVAPFADNNALIPLDDFCKEAGIRPDQYISAYFDICDYDGKIVALPTTPGSTALHYNVDHLASVGYNNPPETIEELDEIVNKLTIVNPKKGESKRLGFLPAEPGWWNWAWGYPFGGKMWDGEKLTVNSPDNIRGYQWVRSFSERFGKQNLQTMKSGFGTFSSAQNPFMDGTVSMVLQGVWMANFIEQHNKNLKWKAAPFPYPKDRPDMKNNTNILLDVLVIPRGAKHPKEAFEFIKYVQTQKAMEKLCLLQKKHSPLLAVTDEFYANHPNPNIKLFAELAKSPSAYAFPQIGMWPEIEQEIGVAFEEVWLMNKTTKEALDYVQNRMQPKFEKYQQQMKKRREAQP